MMKLHPWIYCFLCMAVLMATLFSPVIPARAEAAAASLTPIDQYGGFITRVTAAGQTAYVGVGPRLAFLDLSDPLHPQELAQTGLLPGTVTAVAAREDYAYVGDSAGNLHIFDVSNRLAPHLLHTLVLPAPAADMDLNAETLFIAEGTHGVEAYALADPALPAFVILRTCPGYANGVTLAPSGVFVACSAGGAGFYEDFFDNGIPGIGYGFDAPSEALDIAVSGNDVLVATGPGGLTILELTTDHVGDFILVYKAHKLILNNSMRVVVSGSYAYISVQDTHYWYSPNDGSYLDVIDITDAANPEYAGYHYFKGDAVDIALKETAVYMAGMDGGLHVMNVSDPLALEETATYNPPGSAWQMRLQNEVLYVASGVQGLVMLSAGPSGQLEALGQYSSPEVRFTRWVEVQGNTAYLADDATTLSIVDVANPAAPVFTGSYDTGNDGGTVVVDGESIYLSDWVATTPSHGRILALDGASLASPALRITHDLPSNGTKTVLADGYLYVTNWSSGGLRIFSLPDLFEVGFSTEIPYPIAVTVEGDTAYVLNMDATYPYDGPENAIYVMDISDKSAPSLIRTIPLNGEAYDLWLNGDTLYAAACYGGLHVYDLTYPTDPQETITYAVPGCAAGGSASGNLVYISTLDSGIYTYWYQNPVTGTIPVSGGSLENETGSIHFDFDADTFPSPAVIEIQRPYPGDMPALHSATGQQLAIGGAYFTASTLDGAVPSKPFSITLTYSPKDLKGIDETTLALYEWDGEDWVQEATSMTDTTSNTITANPQHMGTWAVLGTTHRVFLPVVTR